MSKLDRAAILAMEPGRELDKIVCETIFGWSYHGPSSKGVIIQTDYFFDSTTGEAHFNFSPSTDIAAAWKVLTKMEQEAQVSVYSDNNGKWACEIGYLVEDDCETASEAISKAAILFKLESEG